MTERSQDIGEAWGDEEANCAEEQGEAEERAIDDEVDPDECTCQLCKLTSAALSIYIYIISQDRLYYVLMYSIRLALYFSGLVLVLSPSPGLPQNS